MNEAKSCLIQPMGRKVDRVKTDDELYGYKSLVETTDRRLNVNNILRRVKEQKKEDKKLNLLIFKSNK